MNNFRTPSVTHKDSVSNTITYALNQHNVQREKINRSAIESKPYANVLEANKSLYK
jgi:hypothetical protein